MAEKEKASVRRSSHSAIHGGGCGGAVVFPKDPKAIVQDGVCEKCHKIVHKNCGGTITVIASGRECDHCKRQETHAIGQYLIVGQPGVSQKKLEALCKELKLQVLKVLPDASYPEIIALLVAVSDTDAILSPKLLEKLVEKLLVENKDTVRYVYDKPIAYDRFGEPTKYREE